MLSVNAKTDFRARYDKVLRIEYNVEELSEKIIYIVKEISPESIGGQEYLEI